MPIRTYTVDLDDPAEARLYSIMQDHKERIKSVYTRLRGQFCQGRLDNLKVACASRAIGLGSTMGLVIHVDELTYIANECKIPFGEIVILQIMYELMASCTSAVFNYQDQWVHFRTMDWPLNELKDLTIQVNYHRNNQLVYSSITWAGYVGTLTALKPGVCSVSMNYRECNDGLMSNIKGLMLARWPAGYLIRHAMEQPSGWTAAHITQCLMQSRLVAPCYFIVCGMSAADCSVIVRDRLNYHMIKMGNGTSLVQTNIDPFETNPVRDILMSTERKQCASRVIAGLQKEPTRPIIDGIIHEFCFHPIENGETIYISLMTPALGLIEVLDH